ncbi:Pkinase-domain-containing protein, partial [Exidia glandulosa HHB12029]
MNQTKAQLATAYNELGKELSSQKVRVVGNYTLGKVIGEGTYGKVRLGTHRLTGSRVAIKQIPKALSAQLTREIHHHRRLHHPHVTQLYEVIATESYIWLVTELCAGGELFDYLVEKGRLSEEETRAIFGQLCLAVAYIHEKGVVHRDLKLENVLLDERCRVKLGDFGFTREFERGSLLDTFCGTTGYASPEMLLGKKYHGQEVDIWSLGIIVYALLTGTLPFDDDDEDVMRDKIIKGDYDDPEWLTPDARDIIRRILVQDPSKRLSIAQILAHKW